MSDKMTFPETWEEFEKSYGFTDSEEIYTNGSRLIPSFRVKQWLDHEESKRETKQQATVSSDLISRQEAIDAINAYLGLSAVSRTIQNMTSIQEILENLPSASLDLSTFSDKLWKIAYERGKAEGRKKGKWINKKNIYGVAYCSECDYELHTNDTNFCPHCGADMTGGEEE